MAGPGEGLMKTTKLPPPAVIFYHKDFDVSKTGTRLLTGMHTARVVSHTKSPTLEREGRQCASKLKPNGDHSRKRSSGLDVN